MATGTHDSSAGAVPSPAVPEHGGEVALTPHERPHPSDSVYILVALILACLTGGEIGLYYLKGGTPNTIGLLILMLIKFTMVAGFFMHLRFDDRAFRRLFTGGLVLAVAIYVIVLLIFGVL